MIDLVVLLVTQQCLADESVAQIVDTSCAAAATNPASLRRRRSNVVWAVRFGIGRPSDVRKIVSLKCLSDAA